MKLLREICDADIINNHMIEQEINYKVRKAARAIVFDDSNKIALLNVSKEKYHKLPGGGIEKNESSWRASKCGMI